MRFTKSFVFFLWLLTGISWAQSKDGVFLPGPRITVAIPPQPWQVRRAQVWKTVKSANEHDADAMKDFNAILTQFETQPFARTPMENMDILGTFYAPKDDVEGVLKIMSANAVLGWYDALRFGSESGRAEMVTNERFFVWAYVLAGGTTTSKFKEFMKGHPDLAGKAVLQGLAFAERERKNPHYDVRWPTAYGLKRTICAQGGVCNPPKEMPADQWDKAWEDAKKRVTSYYQVNASASSTDDKK